MKKIAQYILVLAILSLHSCVGGKKAPENGDAENEEISLVEITQEQFNAMKMVISTLQESDFDHTIKASGKVNVPPRSRAKVTSFLGGYVKATSLLVGDRVTKGQALLTLESPEYIDLQQSYLEISGQIKYLKSEYDRQKTLFDEKISSQKKYLEAESEYKRAKATFESLRQKLNMLHINPAQVEQGKFSSFITVYSPISGFITEINANVGMAVSPSDVIMEIVETQTMHLELAVFEKDVLSLKTGQRVQFVVPQIDSQKFEATVLRIGKSVERNDRIIHVYAAMDEDTKQKLLIGMYVEARLVTESRKVLCIPYDAVIIEEGDNFLLVFKSEKDGQYTFRKTLVKVGERKGDQIEIIPSDSLNSTAKVLIKGVYDVI